MILKSRRLALADLTELRLTYPEVGATTGAMPTGYDHVRRSAIVGRSRPAFEAGVSALNGWRMHRRAGISVDANSEVAAPGEIVVLGIGWSRLKLHAPCRVVYVVDEPRRRGFAYGTLPGHPECGEEAFFLELDQDETVWLTISAFSKPASRLARIGGPLTKWIQRKATDRYIVAMHSLIASV